MSEEIAHQRFAKKVHLLEVNYNTSPELAKKYGVTLNDAPSFKILHKGIHYATIHRGDITTFQSKLAELAAMF